MNESSFSRTACVDFFLEEGFKGAHACEYLLTIDADQSILKGFKFANWFVFSAFCLVLMTKPPNKFDFLHSKGIVVMVMFI